MTCGTLSPATTDLTALTPAEIDHLLFPLWAARWAHAESIWLADRRIAASLFPKEDGPRASMRDKDADWYGRPDKYTRQVDRLTKAAAAIRASEAALAEAKAAIVPFDAEYTRRGGWTRYILVRGGHLHRQGCSTVRVTTPAYLLAEASGLSAAEVVDRYDFTACTHCFPDAPVLTDAERTARSGACAGTGQFTSPSNPRLLRKYAACPVCGENVSLTSNYKLRKHAAKAS